MTTKLKDALASVINCNSAENGSNTPDFILAEFLADCLKAFDYAVRERERWSGRDPNRGPGQPPDGPPGYCPPGETAWEPKWSEPFDRERADDLNSTTDSARSVAAIVSPSSPGSGEMPWKLPTQSFHIGDQSSAVSASGCSDVPEFVQLPKPAEGKGEAALPKLFLGMPERWYDGKKFRCAKGHVGTMILKSEQRGDLCLGCQAPVLMTFPEDEDGNLLGAEMFAARWSTWERARASTPATAIPTPERRRELLDEISAIGQEQAASEGEPEPRPGGAGEASDEELNEIFRKASLRAHGTRSNGWDAGNRAIYNAGRSDGRAEERKAIGAASVLKKL